MISNLCPILAYKINKKNWRSERKGCSREKNSNPNLEKEPIEQEEGLEGEGATNLPSVFVVGCEEVSSSSRMQKTHGTTIGPFDDVALIQRGSRAPMRGRRRPVGRSYPYVEQEKKRWELWGEPVTGEEINELGFPSTRWSFRVLYLSKMTHDCHMQIGGWWQDGGHVWCQLAKCATRTKFVARTHAAMEWLSSRTPLGWKEHSVCRT